MRLVDAGPGDELLGIGDNVRVGVGVDRRVRKKLAEGFFAAKMCGRITHLAVCVSEMVSTKALRSGGWFLGLLTSPVQAVQGVNPAIRPRFPIQSSVGSLMATAAKPRSACLKCVTKSWQWKEVSLPSGGGSVCVASSF